MHEAAKAMQGEVISGRADAVWRGAALDSRAVRGGELFFALPGKRTDGHRYVHQAYEQGAAAAVIHREVVLPEGRTAIRVRDTYTALHRLTETMRRRAPRQMLAVTGSVGKTTTKELLAAMLERRFRVARNPGNLNNLLGFPIALLGIPEDTEWMVAEMGMSTPGELAAVSLLGRPDVVLLTNVRPVHLEFFGTLRAVAQAKAEILQGLKSNGVLVANRDDREVARIAEGYDGPVVWYSLRQRADYTASEIESIEGGRGSRFELRAPDGTCHVELPLHGLYNVENCLAAAACAHALGVPLPEIVTAADAVEAPAGRGIVHRLPEDVVVIDDTYNSNPTALRAALESACGFPAQRRWAVLGDMLELGEESARFHLEGGRAAAELGFSPVVGVGALARDIVEGARSLGAEGRWYPDAMAAAAALADGIRPGDVVLVKGSRGVALEGVVRALTGEPEDRG